MGFELDDFLFRKPLYEKITINDEYVKSKNFKDLCEGKNIKVQGFNPEYKVTTVFSATKSVESNFADSLSKFTYTPKDLRKDGGIGILYLKCELHETLLFFAFHWEPSNNTLIKVGQYPIVDSFPKGNSSE